MMTLPVPVAMRDTVTVPLVSVSTVRFPPVKSTEFPLRVKLVEAI